MASKEECDRYAFEAARRFDDFVNWAIGNWPHRNFPLASSDFSASRRELSSLLGSRLQDGQAIPESNSDDVQFRDVTPAPWP